MVKDSAAQIELGRSFHQMGTVNEKVCESDFDNICYLYIYYVICVYVMYIQIHTCMFKKIYEIYF